MLWENQWLNIIHTSMVKKIIYETSIKLMESNLFSAYHKLVLPIEILMNLNYFSKYCKIQIFLKKISFDQTKALKKISYNRGKVFKKFIQNI